MNYDPSLPFNDFADYLGNFKVVHRSYAFYTQTTFICKNPDLYSNTPQLKWKCQSTKISWGGGAVFDDQRFASFYQTFCYKISWNYLKFWGRESEQSLILNLNPSPSEKNCVKSCIFLRQNEPVLLKFFRGRPPDPTPHPHLPQFSDTMLKKRRNKEVQTNSRIKKWLVKPYNLPPPFF